MIVNAVTRTGSTRFGPQANKTIGTTEFGNAHVRAADAEEPVAADTVPSRPPVDWAGGASPPSATPSAATAAPLPGFAATAAARAPATGYSSSSSAARRPDTP